MKNTIKGAIVVAASIITIIVYVSLFLFIKFGLITVDKFFSPININWFLFHIIISYIIFSFLSKEITRPINKLIRNMRGLLDGRVIESKKIKEDVKFVEIDRLMDRYLSMLELIKRNNLDLNSQQSKTEIILEQMADGVIAFSITKDIVHMNLSAKELLGIDERFNTFEKIMIKLGIEVDFTQIMYLPKQKSETCRLTTEDTVLNIAFRPFFNSGDIPVGVIMVIRDITEREKLDNMRKEFVANVSHELKTPLTSIKGYSETMMMSDDLPKETAHEFLSVIYKEANRMDKLVHDLLQLSKFDYGKASIKMDNFTISELAKNVIAKMQFTASQKEHTLTGHFSSGIKVYADKASIEQVLVNIISNSIKYTPDGGKIDLYIEEKEDSVEIREIDNGMGIPEKDLKLIFERFYRVDKARSRQMGGTGLGLSIVKEIIASNDGKIDIKSEVDKGTEIIINLQKAK